MHLRDRNEYVGRLNRAFTLVELLVVIGIIALLIAILMPALSRARKQALQASCGSNERQTAYAAIAYSNDWQEQLPTYKSQSFGELYTIARLPIIGFDTTTVLLPLPGFYNLGTSCWGGFGPGLPGWAYMLRDYLKNDKDVVVCPDGWFTTAQIFKRYAGTTACDSDFALTLTTGRNPNTGAATAPGIGYWWLPHRPGWKKGTISVNYNALPCTGTAFNSDGPIDVAKTASGTPDLLVTTDMIYWNAFILPGGGAIFSNHQGADVRALMFRDANAPFFEPCDINRNNPLQMPLGSNRARIDARVTWVPFQDLDPFRYTYLDFSQIGLGPYANEWFMW